MSEPTVCAVMLTRARPQMAARAIASFISQTYSSKHLIVLDGGDGECWKIGHTTWDERHSKQEITYHKASIMGLRKDLDIGRLRNVANLSTQRAGWNNDTILCHWDDDDWSHPNRLVEQVALLQASGADIVGYNEVLFWDTRGKARPTGEEIPGPLGMHPVFSFAPGEAWLYNRRTPWYAIGSSFMYWRRVWEQKPFESLPKIEDGRHIGEDTVFAAGLKVCAVSSIPTLPADDIRPEYHADMRALAAYEPRMVCAVHGGNTQAINYQAVGVDPIFKRVSAWDEYCARVMKL